jgi:hypothetical protein
VADIEGEKNDFEELELPGEDLADSGALGDLAPLDDLDAAGAFDAPLIETESPADEDQQAESNDDESEEDESEEDDAQQKDGFLKTLSQASPYTVMLAVALAAIVTACTCLLLEWSTYHFDIDASDYTQRAE